MKRSNISDRILKMNDLARMTCNLINNQSKATEKFPLFSDVEVGLSATFISERQIEARLDDDVDTDDDIMASANHTCKRDVEFARWKLHKQGWKNVVNNCDIRHRITHPQFYDRTGKFAAYGQNSHEDHIYPSMNKIIVPKVSGSV